MKLFKKSFLTLCLILLGCYKHQSNYSIIIPKDYQGMLITSYGCDEGVSIKQGNNVIKNYDFDGKLCVSEDYSLFASQRVQYDVKYSEGTLIPTSFNRWEYKGDGYVMEEVLSTTRFDVDYGTFGIAWVGSIKEYSEIRNSPRWVQLEDSLLREHFGVPIVEPTKEKEAEDYCKLYDGLEADLDIVIQDKLLQDVRKDPNLKISTSLSHHDSSLTDSLFTFDSETLSFKLIKNSLKSVLIEAEISEELMGNYIIKKKLPINDMVSSGCIRVKPMDGNNFYEAHYVDSVLTRVKVGGVEID